MQILDALCNPRTKMIPKQVFSSSTVKFFKKYDKCNKFIINIIKFTKINEIATMSTHDRQLFA